MSSMIARLDRRVKFKLQRLKSRTRDKGLAMRCQIVLLAAGDKTRPQIAESVGCSLSWAKRVLGRFRDCGIAGLMDRREDNGARKVTEAYLQRLYEVVGASPQDFGRRRPTWTRELLVEVMAQQTGIRVHVATMSRCLRQIGARRGRPRPVVSCPWSKAAKSRRMSQIREAIENVGDNEVVLYADEADIHLNPKIGLDWMNLGQQKEVITPGQNAKRYIAGALDPASGRLTWVLADHKNSLLFIMMLQRLLRLYPGKIIHLVLDNYAIHSSRQTRAYLAEHGQRFRLHFLPPYCPQENRIERKWQDLHANVTRNHTCATIEELVEAVVAYLTHYNTTIRWQQRIAA